MGLKLSLSSCDEWLFKFYLVFRSLSGVLFQLVRCLVNSAVVVGSGVHKRFHSSLDLVFITGK